MIKDYSENGFFIAKSVIPKEVIHKILEETNLVVKQQLKILDLPYKENSSQDDIFHNFKTLFDADSAKYLKSVKILSKNFEVIKLFCRDEIKHLLEQLGIKHCIFPTDPAFHIMSDELKIPGGYYGFAPHQDYPSMQGSLDAPVIWIPLVNIDRNSYPLEIIPKTHHFGMMKGEMRDNCYEVDKSYYKDSDFIPVEVEVGDVVLMTSFTVHRSGLTGRKNSIRLACSNRVDNLEEEFFAKRTYPTVYKRVVERIILEPGFPSLVQVKNIFKDSA